MIYTVTLNPSLDYHVSVDALRGGALNRTHNERLYPGGKGVNVSLVCAALGLSTRALGFIAGHTGSLFSTMLAQTGVTADFCPLEQGMTRINVKVSAHDHTELNGAGPHIPPAALDQLTATLDALHAGDWLVLSGSVPASVPADIYAHLLDRVKDRGVKTLLDTSGDALKNALPCAPDLMKPNLEELCALVGDTPHSPVEIVACARKLQTAGAQNILISCGADGAIFVPAVGDALQISAPSGTVIQAVGAGDSMAAGWLYAYAHGFSTTKALRFAVAAGSAAAFSEWLPDGAHIEEVLRRTPYPISIL